MSDAVLTRDGPVSVPLDYTVPNGGEMFPLTVRATIDGTSAAASYFAVVQVIAPSGRLMANCVSSAIAAGASADVTWFRGVGTAGGSGQPSQTGWTRTAEPLISPSVAWETNVVQEPQVRYESGTWKMWYTAGGANPGMGQTVCTADPRFPGNWTKNAGNPILGQGGSGVAGFVSGIHVTKVAGTYQCFYYDGNGGGNLKRSSSADGLAWAAPSTAIAKGAVGAAPGGWANSQSWFDGSNYWLFVEGSTLGGGGPPWGCWLFKNSSITNDGGWVVQNGGAGLTTLTATGYAQGYGQGPNISEIDGTATFLIAGRDVLWYHVTKGTIPNLQSDTTHAYTTDATFVTWNQSGSFDLIHNGSVYEGTQAADPCVLEVSGASYLFFSGQNAVTLAGYINLATFPGTLSQLLVAIG